MNAVAMRKRAATALTSATVGGGARTGPLDQTLGPAPQPYQSGRPVSSGTSAASASASRARASASSARASASRVRSCASRSRAPARPRAARSRRIASCSAGVIHSPSNFM